MTQTKAACCEPPAISAYLPLFRLRRHLLVFRGRLLITLVFGGPLGRGVVARRGRRRLCGLVLDLVGLVVGLVFLLCRCCGGLVVVVLLHLAEGGLCVGADAARQEHGLLGEVLLALLGHVVAGLDEPLDVAE